MPPMCPRRHRGPSPGRAQGPPALTALSRGARHRVRRGLASSSPTPSAAPSTASSPTSPRASTSAVECHRQQSSGAPLARRRHRRRVADVRAVAPATVRVAQLGGRRQGGAADRRRAELGGRTGRRARPSNPPEFVDGPARHGRARSRSTASRREGGPSPVGDPVLVPTQGRSTSPSPASPSPPTPADDRRRSSPSRGPRPVHRRPARRLHRRRRDAAHQRRQLRGEVAAALPEMSGAAPAPRSRRATGRDPTGAEFVNYFLLAFGAIALLVGTFIIYNTFSMIVAQRLRELALLRAIGASRGQVGRSVVLEALIVGVLGSAIGLAAGIGLAYGLRSLLERVRPRPPVGHRFS